MLRVLALKAKQAHKHPGFQLYPETIRYLRKSTALTHRATSSARCSRAFGTPRLSMVTCSRFLIALSHPFSCPKAGFRPALDLAFGNAFSSFLDSVLHHSSAHTWCPKMGPFLVPLFGPPNKKHTTDPFSKWCQFLAPERIYFSFFIGPFLKPCRQLF